MAERFTGAEIGRRWASDATRFSYAPRVRRASPPAAFRLPFREGRPRATIALRPPTARAPRRAMRRVTLCAAAAALLAACGGADGGEQSPPGVDTTGLRLLAVPAELREGEALFGRHCSACHGEAALGTEIGPPLVHPVYRPGHHADAAFLLAVLRGVRAHHWGFGDMPPLPVVSRDEATAVVAYVRWLQREAGVE
jgi:mono/diheme cytochrome c family protein